MQKGLWVDEIFSLSMATGHSLEHPAAEADPTRGDYIEPEGAQSPSFFRQYMQHETPPAGAQRVIRAVLLSDTNPPLYYLLLNLWTRAVGTNDAALRFFSTLWALACVPLFWEVSRTIGGNRMAWAACALFTVSPIALYYSREGRMYSFLWFLGLSLAWLTLRLHRRGPRFSLIFMWSIIGAAGLLTHYFFAFVWIGTLTWLWSHPGKLPRTHLTAMGILGGLLILPWYSQIPNSLSRWRVTGDWLHNPLTWDQMLAVPFFLMDGILSGAGKWGGSRLAGWVASGLFTLVLALALKKRPWRLFTGQRQLLWLWGLAGILGLILFDLFMKTSASTVMRYALPSLPAALLLGGFCLSRLSKKFQNGFLLLILLAWAPGITDVYSISSRQGDSYPAIAGRLMNWADPSDIVIVHSIPSGVLGVARYLETSVPVASWVVQLQERHIPEDIERLLAGRCRAALVKVHYLGKLSPAEAWLREHAVLAFPEKLPFLPEILYFLPKSSRDHRGPPCPRWNRSESPGPTK